MAEYRLYRFDKEGHIQEPPVIVECEDDDVPLPKPSNMWTASQFKCGTAPVE